MIRHSKYELRIGRIPSAQADIQSDADIEISIAYTAALMLGDVALDSLLTVDAPEQNQE